MPITEAETSRETMISFNSPPILPHLGKGQTPPYSYQGKISGDTIKGTFTSEWMGGTPNTKDWQASALRSSSPKNRKCCLTNRCRQRREWPVQVPLITEGVISPRVPELWTLECKNISYETNIACIVCLNVAIIALGLPTGIRQKVRRRPLKQLRSEVGIGAENQKDQRMPSRRLFNGRRGFESMKAEHE